MNQSTLYQNPEIKNALQNIAINNTKINRSLLISRLSSLHYRILCNQTLKLFFFLILFLQTIVRTLCAESITTTHRSNSERCVYNIFHSIGDIRR